MKLTILGAGFSGRAIARICAPQNETIHGTTRSTENFSAIEAVGAVPLVFDGEGISAEFGAALRTTTHLVQSIAPEREGDGFLKLVPRLRALMPDLTWIGYLSTIGVYGDHKGAWVDETTPVTPLSSRSRERVAAERQWQDAADAANVPLAILRLSGIYGPGRNAFINLERGTARRLVKKDQVFNRIRVEDIGRACDFLMISGIGGVYNVTDNHPSPTQDVVEYAAHLMGLEVPPDIPFDTAELSPMQRSFYAENKRVSNAALSKLGFRFLYPEYRMSLDQMWQTEGWRN